MYASVVRLSSIVLEIRRKKLYEGRGQKSGDYRASPCSTGSKSLKPQGLIGSFSECYAITT
jgi:hypothetical protein